jgi:hypothetical protein
MFDAFWIRRSLATLDPGMEDCRRINKETFDAKMQQKVYNTAHNIGASLDLLLRRVSLDLEALEKVRLLVFLIS